MWELVTRRENEVMMKKPEEKRASSNELLTFSDDELGEMYLAAGLKNTSPWYAVEKIVMINV